jgi:hypothetical protein
LTDAQHLTREQLDNLLSFRGYGNPAGPFWFIGIEERGDATPQELEVKLKFREVEDLLHAMSREVWGHSDLWEDFDPDKLIPTWTTMIKIVLKLKGSADWHDKNAVRDYQKSQLGRLDGETFLTDLLPLAKPSDAHWPEWWPWQSWDEYAEEVLPKRIAHLQTLFQQHHPSFVFCYGKAYWPFHRKIFPSTQFADALDGKIQLADLGSSTIALTPFFAFS